MLKLLLPHPAALIKNGKTKIIVIADPHLGWETGLQQKGIHIPSQTPKILKNLITLLSKYKPDMLVILGDVKYTVVSAEPGEWREIPEFFEKLGSHVNEIVVVRGNHDANLEPLLPENVRILPATGTVIDNVGLFHGHKWPSPLLLSCKIMIMGHLHPVMVFRDPAGFKITRPVWMKTSCNTSKLTKVLLQKNGVKIEGTPDLTLLRHYDFKPRTAQIFVMPSFNEFLGGRPINETRPREELDSESLIGPVLRSEALNVDGSEIYLLDGTYLGTLNQLRRL